ncbi:hypothetical protein FNYG_04183 [Fusarium nygamai]|uniref:Uncharacterized protein n=1 Tax=Gibberella nygamai TaxID=42673 RepID=A0A2K0WJM2_GIBNY|nr:hypothetical protein FNYG_04183 [Fusarium nygamai]
MARRDLAESTETLNDVGSIHTLWTKNAVEKYILRSGNEGKEVEQRA